MQFDEAVMAADAAIKAGINPTLRAKWAKVRHSMAVHLEGEYPASLIDAKRPNEPEEIKCFRQKNYEPITVGVFEEAVAGLFRIFANATDSIKGSEDLLVYIAGNRFEGTDFMSWVQTHLVPRMLIDPNGWAAVLPDGEGLAVPTSRLEPRIELVRSEQIQGYGRDWLLWMADEKVQLGQRGNVGSVYHLLTDEDLIRVEQVSGGTRHTYNYRLIFSHRAGALPAVRLGGVPVMGKDGLWWYESFFRAAVAFGNEVIKQYSDWYAMITTAGFAIRELRAVECKAPGCKGGIICGPDGEEVGTCKVCHGTGFVPDSSPYGVFLQPQADALTGADPRPPVIFHTPPVEPLAYAERSWQEQYRRMRQALHLDYVDEAQSGVAKAIDREPAYAQLLRISNHVWDSVIWTLLDAIESMRNITGGRRTPEVIKPTEFSMRSEADLVSEISRLKQTNAPADLVMEVLRELIRKRYAGDDLLIKKHEFLIQTDPLYDASDQMRAFYLNAGVIDREQALYGLWAGSIVDGLIAITRPDPMVLFRDINALAARVREIIRARTPQQVQIPLLG